MSLEFLEGWDHYTDVLLVPRKWDSTSSTSGISIFTGRFSGNSLTVGGTPGITITLTAQQTRIAGFAFRPSGFAAGTLVRFLDGATTQVELRIDASGILQVTRNATLLGAAAAALIVNTWVYIEFKAMIASSGGTYDVHVNGVSVISGTGNTQNTANATCNVFHIAGPGTFNSSYDDLYILNTSGSSNNNFLGDCRIITGLPNADGSTDQWTPSTGTAHYATIDESNPNDDTDYNSSSGVGQIDLVKFPAISPTGPILGVQTVMTARKDDVGVREIVEQCKSGATTYNGSSTMSLQSSYLMGRQIRETDPATGLAWNLTALNAAEFGVKVSA